MALITKAWIDDDGDVVWIDITIDPDYLWTDWNECLMDGCRLNNENNHYGRINGLWMILE